MNLGGTFPGIGGNPAGKTIRAAIRGLVLLVVAVLLVWILKWLTIQRIPDFSAIHDIRERKAAFFEYMEPYVRKENGEIFKQRKRLHHLERIRERQRLNRRDARWVRTLGETYGLKLEADETIGPDMFSKLLKRVDIIPDSLALAQAAIESGWGTSRFARQGNNLYGMWCYKPGCGIVPKKRPKGATYEVASYRSPGDSVRAYMLNLNSNQAYADLRRIRFRQREQGELLQGLTLSDGLYRYSTGRWEYVRKLQRLIRTNKLSKYDEEQY